MNRTDNNCLNRGFCGKKNEEIWTYYREDKIDALLYGADTILEKQPEKDLIKRICSALLQHIFSPPWDQGNMWTGACYATSAILYVLFCEIGLSPSPCIGVVSHPLGIKFDHSWIEVNGEVYDMAICCPLVGAMALPPVIRNRNAETGEFVQAIYGIKHDYGLDNGAIKILRKNIGAYMDGFSAFLSSNHPNYTYIFPEKVNGLWDIASDIGRIVGLTASVSLLRNKYGRDTWIHKSANY